MIKFIKKLSLTLLLAFVSIAFVGSNAYAESTIETAKKRNAIRVGFSSFVPWAMQNKAGEFIGFEIDVAKRLSDDLGLRFQPTPTAWAGIIPALLANKVDVIIGGMGISEERLKQVDFTIPYNYNKIGIMANIQTSSNLKSLEDYNKPEVVITARNGTSGAIAGKDLFPNATHRYFNDEASCLQEVFSGRANAFLSSGSLSTFTIIDNPDKVFKPFDMPSKYDQAIGFAVRKGDEETLKVFNEWIAKVEAEGWLQERADYWFNTKNWEKEL